MFCEPRCSSGQHWITIIKETGLYAKESVTSVKDHDNYFLLNGIDTRSFNNTYRSALYDASNYYVGRKLERVANKNGLSFYELNVLLSVNSDIGKAVAGTAYKEKNGKVYITGFMSRSKPVLGLIWDVNDTLLGYQGLLVETILKKERAELFTQVIALVHLDQAI